MTATNSLNIHNSGYIVFDGVETFQGRTIQAGTGISVSNGNGLSGNTVISSTGPTTDLHTARFIVSAGGNAQGANYTTIAAAYADAVTAGGSQTVFIQPGTYTESFIMSPNINLAAYSCDSTTPNVTISGTITASYTGTASISGINLTTNGANPAINVTGSNSGILYLRNCQLNALSNTALTANNANFVIFVDDCYVGASSSNAVWNITNINALALQNCDGINGSVFGTSTIAAGTVNIYSSVINFSLSTSGTGSYNIHHCYTNLINTTFLTLAGTGSSTMSHGYINTGTASSISVGSGCTLQLSSTGITSSNTNVITGLGTLNYGNITFLGSSSTINTTTTNQQVSTVYVKTGSWTPGVSFGGGTTGITYTTQSGEYSQVGNMIFASYNITLSNKGSSTGNAFLTGLPVAAAGTAIWSILAFPILASVPASTSNIVANPSGTSAALYGASTTATGLTNLTNSNFSNTSQLNGCFFYFTS